MPKKDASRIFGRRTGRRFTGEELVSQALKELALFEWGQLENLILPLERPSDGDLVVLQILGRWLEFIKWTMLNPIIWIRAGSKFLICRQSHRRPFLLQVPACSAILAKKTQIMTYQQQPAGAIAQCILRDSMAGKVEVICQARP